MVPAALLEDLIVLLMVHVRRPSDRQHPRVAFAHEFSISMPLDVSEPHQQAAPFWPPFGLCFTADPQTWVPRHVRVSARPLMQRSLILDAMLFIAIALKWFGGLGWGPSRAHYLNRGTQYGYGNDPYECSYG
jgi:hypothetical protein